MRVLRFLFGIGLITVGIGVSSIAVVTVTSGRIDEITANNAQAVGALIANVAFFGLGVWMIWKGSKFVIFAVRQPLT